MQIRTGPHRTPNHSGTSVSKKDLETEPLAISASAGAHRLTTPQSAAARLGLGSGEDFGLAAFVNGSTDSPPARPDSTALPKRRLATKDGCKQYDRCDLTSCGGPKKAE